jgi:hypothetical protein
MVGGDEGLQGRLGAVDEARLLHHVGPGEGVLHPVELDVGAVDESQGVAVHAHRPGLALPVGEGEAVHAEPSHGRGEMALDGDPGGRGDVLQGEAGEVQRGAGALGGQGRGLAVPGAGAVRPLGGVPPGDEIGAPALAGAVSEGDGGHQGPVRDAGGVLQGGDQAHSDEGPHPGGVRRGAGQAGEVGEAHRVARGDDGGGGEVVEDAVPGHVADGVEQQV